MNKFDALIESTLENNSQKTPEEILSEDYANKFDFNKDKFYLVCKRWHYYEDGITGRNDDYFIYANEDGEGFSDRTEANEIKKELAKEDREAMKKFRKSGYISKGSQGGTYIITLGKNIDKAVAKTAGEPTYKYLFSIIFDDE